ncbi:maker731, partial [Drosophila busckii]
ISLDSQHSWVKGGLSEVVPKNALIGGFNDKGYQLYVGRRIYNNSVLPARVIVETGVSTANWNDTAWVINGATYQLLVTQPDMDYLWVHSYNGYYEQGAIAVGTSDMNERIFICRAQIKNGLMFGSLYLKQNRCVIDGNLLTLYEVLVARPKFEQNPKLQEFHSMPGVPESEDLPISEQVSSAEETTN